MPPASPVQSQPYASATAILNALRERCCSRCEQRRPPARVAAAIAAHHAAAYIAAGASLSALMRVSLDSALLSAANSIDAIPQAGTDRPRPTCSGVHRAASFCHGRRGPSSTPPARPRLAAAAQCIWHACPCIHVRRAHERVIHLRVRCNVPSPIGRICAQIGISNVFASQRWLPRDTGLPVVHRERSWLRV